VSRRGRAVAFASAAAICAGLAAGASGGGADLETQYGELRPVVVASQALPARSALGRKRIDAELEVRRVPERFLPPGALTEPEQALGRAPASSIPAGGYVTASQLMVPGAAATERGPGRVESGHHPVEITVAAAESLASSRSPRHRVDVVVTTDPGPGGSGRTYVAARNVQLLDLRTTGDESGATDVLPGPGTAAWVATLALTREQALRLIHAESFARSVRLFPR
jgi:Flp pilus assembly protein CpaB